MVKVDAKGVLFPPKLSTATALFDWVELYINAPAAVKVAPVQTALLKLIYAVVVPPEVGEVDIVNVAPPVVYPVPVTSFVGIPYAVVSALSVAVEEYKAILKVLGDVGPKLCTP